MNKSIEIFNFITERVTLEGIEKEIGNQQEFGIDARTIELKLSIIRNNASTILNNLNKQGKLIKIQGRPVRFIPASIIENKLLEGAVKEEYSEEEIKKILSLSNDIENQDSEDCFQILVGHNLSLKNQIEQAKAAVMYPPDGLHTLIIGPSGVGKTTFASTMYEYARMARNKSQEEFPFISFNCSDYYNNPQLLLAQLFGHVKGAFTGAETNKAGLVEKADGGILFLDEIHRLTPDGQEMLFYLMDKGEYHRLGETDKIRRSNVLIIAATTEDPQEVLLRTFLRRIPVIVSLPSLNEKGVGERINIIENLFTKEAIRINRKLIVSPEVLKALAIYECKGNVGQLKSDIKLICAKSYLKNLHSEKNLKIEFEVLPKSIKDAVFSINKLEDEVQEYLNIFNEDIVIYPIEKQFESKEATNENVYKVIRQRTEELKEEGLSNEAIDVEIGKEIENYYGNIMRRLKYKEFNFRELYKIIDKNIVDFSLELINFASEKLNKEFNNIAIFGFVFHLNSLLERIKKKKYIINYELSKIKDIYSEQYKIAANIVKQIEVRFQVSIPVDENGYIAILLANNEERKQDEEKVGILVVAHGVSTATSMANVCNTLLNSALIKAIDMPLEKSIEEIYQKAVSIVKVIDRGKGVILLVDMGSLVNFGQRITEETGIITRTIDRVSTPVILEVLTRVMYKNESIDEIYGIVEGGSSIQTVNKPKAVITVCATGKGTSIMLENIISDMLMHIDKDNKIKVIPVNYMTVKNNAQEYQEIIKNYDVIACIGNLRPINNIPYFSMEDVLIKSNRYKFNNFIESKIGVESTVESKSPYNSAKEMLEEFTLYINPKKTVDFIEKFICDLDLPELENNEALIASLSIHLGFMLERVVTQKNIIFDNLEPFKCRYFNYFNRMKRSMRILEENFVIIISDDEICYALQVIMERNKGKD